MVNATGEAGLVDFNMGKGSIRIAREGRLVELGSMGRGLKNNQNEILVCLLSFMVFIKNGNCLNIIL